MTALRRRRAILIVCDGLGAGWIGERHTPTLAALSRDHRRAADHRAVFPSVTRVSAASIATGCYPGRHGLEGNQMALVQDGRIVVHNAGAPSFRQTMKSATGRTLRVPTLAQRLASSRGQIAYSNVSPGAAYFLDPDHFGTVLHRSGSFGPGGTPITGAAHLGVSHDLAGDREMTKRFCHEVVPSDAFDVAILWLSNPDLTLHHDAMGSPAHIEALEVTDALVAGVASAIAAHEDRFDTLLVVGSDHGHETIGRSIHIGNWLAANGLGAEVAGGKVGVASQGTSALLYATDDARTAVEALFPLIRRQPWAGELLQGDGLAATGLAGKTLIAAIDTTRGDDINGFGVRGARWLVEDGEGPPEIGCGHHGGLGPDETRPFLLLVHPAYGRGPIDRPTSLVDIGPSILAYLGQATDGMDGTPIVT